MKTPQPVLPYCWVVNLFITLTNHLPSFMSKSLVWNNQKENQAKLTQRKRGCQKPHLISIMCSLVPLHSDAFWLYSFQSNIWSETLTLGHFIYLLDNSNSSLNILLSSQFTSSYRSNWTEIFCFSCLHALQTGQALHTDVFFITNSKIHHQTRNLTGFLINSSLFWKLIYSWTFWNIGKTITCIFLQFTQT